MASLVLLALAGSLFSLKVGGLLLGSELLDRRVGYCFDLATDSSGHRLLVAAGTAGLHLFDVEDGALEYLCTYYDGGYYRNLDMWNDRVYVADSKRGLVVVDVSGQAPATTWVQESGEAMGIHVDGATAYVAAFGDGLAVFDLSERDAPVLLDRAPTGGYAWDVWVNDGFAYVADFQEGLVVFDVTSPAEPRQVSSITWTDGHPTAEILRGEGDTVYVAASSHGLIVVNVSDPHSPLVTSSYRPLRIGYAEGVAVKDGLVYLAMRSRIKLGFGDDAPVVPTSGNGLHILDTKRRGSPALVGRLPFVGHVEGVHVADGYAYVANAFRGVRSIDVRDPDGPVLADTFAELPPPTG